MTIEISAYEILWAGLHDAMSELDEIITTGKVAELMESMEKDLLQQFQET